MKKIVLSVLMGALLLGTVSAGGVLDALWTSAPAQEPAAEPEPAPSQPTAQPAQQPTQPAQQQSQTAQTASSGGLVFTPEGNGYKVSGEPSLKGAVVIPATYNGKPVTTIGNQAFYGCTGLTSITIPASVTSIESGGVFSGCTSLANITVDANNRNYSSEGGVLYNKDKTSLIRAPEGISGVVNVPASVKSIFSFDGCSRITAINFAQGIKLEDIHLFAFRDCTGIASITIPEGVRNVSNAFIGWTASQTINVTFTSSGKPSGWIPGWNSSAAKVVDLGGPPSDVYTPGLEFNVTPNGLIVFCRPERRTTLSGAVVIPAILEGMPVIEIARNAFSGFTNITSVTIPNSVTTIGEAAFAGSGITSVTIPASVTSIGLGAFGKNPHLTSVTFAPGSRITDIGRSAFQDCTGLTSITFASGSRAAIGQDAFMRCTRLASVTMPDNSVTSIGQRAFIDCSSLASVTIGEGLTTIGDYAFQACTKIARLTIPLSVTSVGRGAFSRWTASQVIVIQNTSRVSGWDARWKDVCNAAIEAPAQGS